MRTLFVIVGLMLLSGTGRAQVSLLDSISLRQIGHDAFYTSGLFPSQIVWRGGRKSAEDNNIFFTAITLYTLQSLRQQCSTKDQHTIDSLYGNAKSAFKYYQNRKEDITYNFYQVHPDNAFPGVKLLSKIFHVKLPDDLDDTSVLYLIQPTTDSLNIALKKKMVKEVFDEKKIKSTYKEYRKSLAYRTWFADKMNQDLDVCVNSNVLTFVFQKGLALDSVDKESIRQIKSLISNDLHIKSPHLAAPHYQNTSIILYHVARLMAIADNGELNEMREKVIGNLRTALLSAKNDVEKVILLSSLYRLEQNFGFEIEVQKLKRDMNEFYWFRTNMMSVSPFWIKRIFGKGKFLLYKHKSEAYYWSLLLELEKLSGAQFEIDVYGRAKLIKKV